MTIARGGKWLKIERFASDWSRDIFSRDAGGVRRGFSTEIPSVAPVISLIH